jgi:hypothetical protein
MVIFAAEEKLSRGSEDVGGCDIIFSVWLKLVKIICLATFDKVSDFNIKLSDPDIGLQKLGKTAVPKVFQTVPNPQKKHPKNGLKVFQTVPR